MDNENILIVNSKMDSILFCENIIDLMGDDSTEFFRRKINLLLDGLSHSMKYTSFASSQESQRTFDKIFYYSEQLILKNPHSYLNFHNTVYNKLCTEIYYENAEYYRNKIFPDRYAKEKRIIATKKTTFVISFMRANMNSVYKNSVIDISQEFKKYI